MSQTISLTKTINNYWRERKNAEQKLISVVVVAVAVVVKLSSQQDSRFLRTVVVRTSLKIECVSVDKLNLHSS